VGRNITVSKMEAVQLGGVVLKLAVGGLGEASLNLCVPVGMGAISATLNLPFFQS